MAMTKDRFIDEMLISVHPKVEDIERCINYAIAAWDERNRVLAKLSQGQPKEKKPRQSVDYYAQLSERQKEWFNKFWLAFNHKAGKNNAMMRWGQMGEMDDAHYQHIVKAAKAESQKVLPQGQVRKMAEGWLHERRWEDYIFNSANAQTGGVSVGVLVSNKMNELKQLQKINVNGALDGQIAKLQAEIESTKAG